MPSVPFIRLFSLLTCTTGLLFAEPRIGQQAAPLRVGTVVQGSLKVPTVGRAMVIEFWATWCGPCRENIPHLNELVNHFKDRDIDFVSLSAEPVDTIQRFLRVHPINGIVATDPDGAMAITYGIIGIPTTVLIDPNGSVAAVPNVSTVNAAVIEALLSQKTLPLTLSQRETRDAKHESLAPGQPLTDADALARVVIRRADNTSGSALLNGQFESKENLRTLLAEFYNIPPHRIEMASYLAQELYAVQAWVPPRHPEKLAPLLQQGLLAAASIQVEHTKRPTDILVISGMPGKLPPCRSDVRIDALLKPGKLDLEGGTAEAVRDYIATALGKDVLLTESPTGKFVFKAEWDPMQPAQLESILREKYGLQLKHEERALDFLVVHSDQPQTTQE